MVGTAISEAVRGAEVDGLSIWQVVHLTQRRTGRIIISKGAGILGLSSRAGG